MPEFRATLYNPATKTSRSGGLEMLEAWDAEEGSWVWLDISGIADDVESKLLTERFGVSPLAIQDAHRDRHPPKIEFFSNQIFIILRDLLGEDENLQRGVSQLALFLGPNFLVTRHLQNVHAIESVFDAVQSNPALLKSAAGIFSLNMVTQVFMASPARIKSGKNASNRSNLSPTISSP